MKLLAERRQFPVSFPPQN